MSLEHPEHICLPHDLSEFDEIIDVRSPGEFADDHLPEARNLPVLSNIQRSEVGSLYKKNPFEARRLGARYVSESIAGHLAGPLRRVQPGWNPLLYCWRGGQRSSSFASVLRSIGWRARTLEGGYKAYRRFVMEDLDRRLSKPDLHFRIISGLTGVGKTRLLHILRNEGGQIVDLEHLANHRGSLLGAQGSQPTQRLFESRLHKALSILDPARPVFTEAESNRIGSVYLPSALWRKFSESGVVELTLSIPERVKLLLEDYAHFPCAPDTLSSLVDQLRKLRGHDRVEQWRTSISEGRWTEFVTSLLENHYDLCYRRPGSPNSNYQAPAEKLPLPDCSAMAFREVAIRLLESQSARPE